jgi:hypothetical protein
MMNEVNLTAEKRGRGVLNYIVDCRLLIVDWKNKNWIPVGVYT